MRRRTSLAVPSRGSRATWCINECPNRHAAGTPAYRWEFTEGGREIVVAVPSRVLSTDSAVHINLARAGLGLTIVCEDQVRNEVARGELVPVLEEFCEPFPGFYLFYPQCRHASPALRALVDHLCAALRARECRRRLSWHEAALHGS